MLNVEIPKLNDSKWLDVVRGDINIDIEFFPLKLLLARQRLQIQLDPTEETLKKCAHEVRQMFEKNKNHPVAKKDLQKIFKRKGFLRRIFGS